MSNDQHSNWSKITVGVLQGPILDSVLFTILLCIKECNDTITSCFFHMYNFSAMLLRLLFLVQVRLRTEVLRTPNSTWLGFELLTSRSWQYIPCHWDACSNHSSINDFPWLKTEVLRTPNSTRPGFELMTPYMVLGLWEHYCYYCYQIYCYFSIAIIPVF